MKTIQTEFPAEYAAFVETALRWFERYGVPVMCRNWFQTSRSVKANKVAATKLPSATSYWKPLNDATKQLWRNAAKKATGYYRGYQLFVSDFIWRQKNGLSLPGTPSDFHQLFGLELTNPGGASDVEARRDDKDLVGYISYKLSFKKTEITPSATYKFSVNCTAYYFSDGGLGIETDTYEAVAGNIDWTTINRQFGLIGRKYFHFKIVISIANYDADVLLDNFELSDASGVIMRENWNVAKYAAWIPTALYRKKDWVFKPAYAEPYFKHLYLG